MVLTVPVGTLHMFVFFEDDGQFKAGHILSETDASLQIESETGKRSKLKRSNTLFTFAAPDATALMAQASDAAADLDIPFLWEVAPQEEFDAQELALSYFGHTPSSVEHAAVIMRLHSAPIYFHRRGRGRYRPAPPDILEAALAAQEKKQRQAEQLEEWVEAMATGTLPEPIAQVAESLVVRPDKNTMAWKALEAACARTRKRPDRLLLDLGAWPHALALHQRRFLAVNFPRGLAFPPVDVPPVTQDLPLSDAEIYSIDDVTTTEIDDALSVTVLDDNKVRVGIHVAAPGLSVTRDSELDQLARARLSTVYMPGDKIPMQPDEVIAAFSLDAGRAVPALSLYVTADLDTGDITATETKVERITVRENLRHNHLDGAVTEAALDDETAAMPYAHWLRPLWRLATALSRKREEVRGKPENNSRVEYSFYLDGDPNDPDTPVRLVPRQRNAPLDRMVAEYMILANNVWGGLLAETGLPGIYRSQQAGRVRMSTQALPHEAIGVPQYAWCTSPLRRYVDLVNQWQLIAAVEHGVSARLVAPFKPRDADLFAIISAFETQYAAWADFQNSMERYWCLRWVAQQGLTRTTASVLRDDLVRLGNAPLVTRISGMPALARGTEVDIEIFGADELTLELDAAYRETRADQSGAPSVSLASDLAESGAEDVGTPAGLDQDPEVLAAAADSAIASPDRDPDEAAAVDAAMPAAAAAPANAREAAADAGEDVTPARPA